MWICPGGGGGGGGDREDARPAPRSAVGAAGTVAVPRDPRAWWVSGRGVLSPAPRSMPLRPGPAGHLGRPFPPFSPPLCEKAGLAVGVEWGHLVPKVWTSSPPLPGRAPSPALLAASCSPLPVAARTPPRPEAGSKSQKLPFWSTWVRGVGQFCPLCSAFPGVEGEPRAGCPGQPSPAAERRWAERRNARSWHGGSGGRASKANGLHLHSQT